MRMWAWIIRELKFWEDCKKYEIGIWECPKFLFLVMGGTTALGMIATHIVATRYAGPDVTIISVVVVAIAIFTIGHTVVNSFDKMANANRLKTEFVNIISHQMRTPLSSVKWSLDLMLSGRLGDLEGKQLEFAKTAKEGNERMLSLVSDLLNLIKTEQGRLVLRKEDVVLKKIVEASVVKAKNFTKGKKVSIKIIDKLDGRGLIHADSKYIAVVLENLIRNAVSFSKDQTDIRIKIWKQREKVRVEVVDSGVGIPKHEQRDVFKKFFRSRNEMSRKIMGSGLGLYISRSFIRMHGGRMGFSSVEGEGSTFWFELPIK